MGNPTTALVTGYIPIQGHPRSAEEYGALGENMFSELGGDFYIHPFYETVGETWLHKLINQKFGDVKHAVADNPEKNTLSYHMVQHQKFGWLLKAKMLNPDVKTLVWMDYGIGHVPGVTPDIVNLFMAGLREDDFAIPGCWTKEQAKANYNYHWPNWRFCGGVFVVPADRVYYLYQTVKAVCEKHIKRTNTVDWEVNTLFRAEKFLPHLRWYKADHNEKLFTNYGAPPCPSTASSQGSADQSVVTSTPT